MKGSRMAVLLGAAALVGGCEARFGQDGGNGAANGQASAEGKAETGRIALSTPGFDLKISVPLDRANGENEGKILYPGGKITGMYIAAHPGSGAGGDGEVELRFAAPDLPEKVAAWYRDPARSVDFTLSSDAKEGAALVMTGTEKEDGGGFKLRLEAKDGGTDGRLTLRDRF